jgi:hypothetical protein
MESNLKSAFEDEQRLKDALFPQQARRDEDLDDLRNPVNHHFK